MARCFLSLLPRLEESGIDSLDALLEFLAVPAAPLDLSSYDFTADDLRALPSSAGVYLFRDREGEVIYVGKAKNLRSRIASYFTHSAQRTPKGRAILEQVRSFEIQPVDSELEAILLEAALLSEKRPRLNRQFEVHERPAPYGPRLNLIVVLESRRPDDREPTCTLHLMRDGRYLQRIRGLRPPRLLPGDVPDESPWDRARETLDTFYFSRSPGVEPRQPEGIDVDWQLVASFLNKHRDRVNVLDVDECADLADASERLRVLVEATLAGRGRVLAR